jgi:small subunit ribosomal protein S14
MATPRKSQKIIKLEKAAEGQDPKAPLLPAPQPLLALRPAARFLRKFGVCRLCFRQLALNGEIPGVVKASW